MASDDAICKTPLYNRYAAFDPRGVCPTGWHIPTVAEVATLSAENGGDAVSGGFLKQDGEVNWLSPNLGTSNNTLNFIGSGYGGDNGVFASAKYMYKAWINDASATGFGTVHNQVILFSNSQTGQKQGHRIRCVKDNNIAPTAPVVDADGNTYDWVGGGSTFWLATDLKTTKFNNGNLDIIIISSPLCILFSDIIILLD